MAGHVSDRAVDAIAGLAREPRDPVSFWRACTAVVADVIPHYKSPCWLTVDPESLLVTGHFHEELRAVPPDWLATGYADDGAGRGLGMLKSGTGVTTLHEATGGDPTHSPRWHVNMRIGAHQEMLTRLGLPTGEVWGALGLYREQGTEMFTDADKGFLAAAAPYLAEGTRRAVLLGQASAASPPDAPAMVVLSEGWEIRSRTPGIEYWLADLPGGDPGAGQLPSALAAVAAHALHKARTPQSQDGSGPARSRVMGRSGNWAVVHGSPLESSLDSPFDSSLDGGGERRVAIIVERARPQELFPILMSAYELTPRERDITRLVLDAATTAEIAQSLFISPHTVQQHLKNIFAKTGVRSRRALVGKVFSHA
ncbi:helix-turn-helix transcriptional regulator [Streptomyces varsoviensis]|uniref:helix-turn-helix transcriptional regulator n=1 Tax=Streptomyces varsoviensis TaxID=67373 RepID=UPI0033DEA935